MKTKILIVACFLSTVLFSQNNSEYFSRMKENISQMDSSWTPENWQMITNNFEMIAGFDTTEWLSEYYAGYANLMMNFFKNDKDEKDLYLSKAMNFADKADIINPKNDEVYLLKSYILQMQISIKPMQRGRTFGQKSQAMLEQAKTINPENPRYYLLAGENLYYTPAMFGGDKEKAKEMLLISLEKFKTFVPKTEIYPKWGLYEVNMMLKEMEKKN
jgi:hypothetical protein